MEDDDEREVSGNTQHSFSDDGDGTAMRQPADPPGVDSINCGRSLSHQDGDRPQPRQYQTFLDSSHLERQELVRSPSGSWAPALGGAAAGASIMASGVYIGATMRAAQSFGFSARAAPLRA